MPDGDRVHPELAGRFQKPYIMLCEGHNDNKILAEAILKPFKKNLQIYGNEPVTLIKQAAEYISDLKAKEECGTAINWGQAQKDLETLMRRTPGNKKGLNLAWQAAKQELQAVRHGIDSTNIELAIADKHVNRAYKSDFENRIPLVPQHYNGVSPVVVDNRLLAVRPDVEKGLHRFASQLVTKEDVKKLRLGPTSKPKGPLSADTSIFSLGKIGA